MKPFLLAAVAVIALESTVANAQQTIRTPARAPVAAEADWVFSAEGMAMWRGGFTRNGLVLDTTLNKNFDSSIVEPDGAAAGMRAYIEKKIGGGRSVELGGFFTAPSSRSALLTNSSELLFAAYDTFYNPANPSFSNSNVAYSGAYTYSTQVMGVEANYKMPFYALGPNVNVFGGVRWIRLKDGFSSWVSDDLASFQGLATNNDYATIRMTNDLFGLQIGLQGMMPVGNGFAVGGRGAFGLYANSIERNFSFFSQNGSTGLAVNPFANTTNTTAFAQALELMPRVEYAFARNWVAFVSGQYLMLHGVGDVTSGYGDFGRVPGGTLTTDNTAHFYGVSGGLKVSFTP